MRVWLDIEPTVFNLLSVTPAKAGVHGSARELLPTWIPAFAGMTVATLQRIDSN
jgi:hypothetical protein